MLNRSAPFLSHANAYSYSTAFQSYEYDYDYAPQWRKVLRYFRWTKRIDMMAALYVKQIFGLQLEAELPPVSHRVIHYV